MGVPIRLHKTLCEMVFRIPNGTSFASLRPYIELSVHLRPNGLDSLSSVVKMAAAQVRDHKCSSHCFYQGWGVMGVTTPKV